MARSAESLLKELIGSYIVQNAQLTATIQSQADELQRLRPKPKKAPMDVNHTASGV